MPSDATFAPPTAGPARSGPATPPQGAVFHPWIDFLCLGGLSVLVLPLMLLVDDEQKVQLGLLAFVLSDIVNHPHFAHSYQIFYRGFREKAFGDTLAPGLRLRYRIAGILVPTALALYFAASLIAESQAMLGYAANLMAFLVGWHYTKQGYGMLMVDSVFKRRFFNDRDKWILRQNAYACWIFYWIAGNIYISEQQYWDISVYAIPMPEPALWVSGAIAALTSAGSLWVLAKKALLDGKPLPWTGVMAYTVSLYIWLLARLDPATLIFVPAFHSLQYLLIVWRYEVNRAQDSGAEAAMPASVRLLGFGIGGVLLGLAGFYWLPSLLDGTFALDGDLLGEAAWFFVFAITINIHHYFIDNVIWRRDNPETRKYLFGAK